MARTDPQVNFRIPAQLKERLEKSAAGNNRTLTSEIVERLTGSYFEDDKLAHDLEAHMQYLQALRKDFKALREEISGKLGKPVKAANK